jgi:hypothetical protein
MDPTSRILDLGSWNKDPGSRILDPGSWIQDGGTRMLDLQRCKVATDLTDLLFAKFDEV